jgi:hypothetical protein
MSTKELPSTPSATLRGQQPTLAGGMDLLMAHVRAGLTVDMLDTTRPLTEVSMRDPHHMFVVSMLPVTVAIRASLRSKHVPFTHSKHF